MKEIFYFIGHSFCHQIADRSFFISGIQLPVCARCTGSAIGMLATVLFLFVFKRLKGNKPPGISIMLLMAAGFLILGADAVSSYMHLRETNNLIRLTTGIMAGSMFPILFTLISNYDINVFGTKPIVKNLFEILIIWLAALLISCLIFVKIGLYIISIIISLAILYFYMNLFLLIINLLKPKFKFKIVTASALSIAAVIAVSILSPL